MTDTFDDIRCYRDHEAKETSRRLLSLPQVSSVFNALLPGLINESLDELIDKIDSIEDFQHHVILPIFKKNILSTFDDLTVSGLENLEKGKAYLFISNHRDIVLDSAVLNYYLHINDFSTAEIAIGDNLLKENWIKELVRLNKSFIVKRGLDKMGMLEASKRMSEYIKDTIINRNESIWIAQRAGRAKDGNDETNRGLISMFGMSAEGDPLDHFKKLNIVPVSVSYELDPCDGMKTQEIYTELTNGSYQKSENEDVESMKMGIVLPKGKGHLHFGKVITPQLNNMSAEGKKSLLMGAISEAIDVEIQSNYKLWPTNFMANYWLDGPEFDGDFTIEEEKKFEDRLENMLDELDGDREELRDILLSMYQIPLLNYLKRTTPD